MAPKYKLTYFNITGLGEPIRYLLAYGNIEYEDNRVEFADWPKLKPSTPYGQLPIFEEDGKQITQSGSVCRYLGKKLGIAGKSDWEALQADAVVDTLTDLRLQYTAHFRAQTPEDKEKIMNDIKSTHNPFYLERLEEVAKKNGGYFVNNQLTWADIYFAALSDLLSNVATENILAKYPTLNALKEKVDNLPGIKAHRDKRPKTI